MYWFFLYLVDRLIGKTLTRGWGMAVFPSRRLSQMLTFGFKYHLGLEIRGFRMWQFLSSSQAVFYGYSFLLPHFVGWWFRSTNKVQTMPSPLTQSIAELCLRITSLTCVWLDPCAALLPHGLACWRQSRKIAEQLFRNTLLHVTGRFCDQEAKQSSSSDVIVIILTWGFPYLSVCL